MHKDLQTRAAWRNMRDERVLKKVTEQTAIATKIAEENQRFRAEEQMQKKGGGNLTNQGRIYVQNAEKTHGI